MSATWPSFGWGVPPAGFRWVKAAPAAEPDRRPRLALVPVAADRESVVPPPDPTLFLQVADLSPGRDAIRQFATNWGNLIEEDLVAVGRGDAAGVPVRGCLLKTWHDQLSAVQRAVGVWQMFRAGDTERLNRHVVWEDAGRAGPAVVFVSHPDKQDGGTPLGFQKIRAVIASADVIPERLARLRRDDPAAAAWSYLYDEMRDHLPDVGDDLATTMGWDPATERLVFGLEARTLLAAIWAQIADAMNAERTFTRCRECRTWFEVGPAVARSHRGYCSNACRSRAYRERMGHARRLHAAGKSFAEIAGELDSDAATVAGWITGTTGGRGE